MKRCSPQWSAIWLPNIHNANMLKMMWKGEPVEDELFQWIGLQSTAARYGLGVASIAAFAASLVLLLIDWRGWAARHDDAAIRWSTVVALFREAQAETGEWPSDKGAQLHQSYWGASKNSVDVPDKMFNRLKAKYLMKREISKRVQASPGAPRILLWLLVRLAGTAKAVRDELDPSDKEGSNGRTGEKSTD